MAGQRIALPQYSAYTSTPVYDLGDGQIVFGLMQPSVLPDNTDQLWTIPQAGAVRFDLLSNELYGTPALWWVLASVNNIIDPLLGVTPGTQIRVPTKTRLGSLGVLNV